jgi:putative ABC transport system permease protein
VFLALRDLRVGRSRFALVGVVIALVALLTTMLSGLATGLVDDGISGLRSLPLTHLAFQPGAQSVFSRSSLDERNLAPWRSVGGVDATPIGVSFFNAKTAAATTVDLALFGIEPTGFLARREGATLALDAEGLVLSDGFKETGLEVGDLLTIVGPDRTLPVLGFTSGGTYGHVDLAFVSLSLWQDLVYGSNARGRFSAIALRAGDTSAFPATDKAAETHVQSKAAAYQGSPGFSAETTTMDLIRGFLMVIASLIVGAFFTVWTVQRTRQIGLMKALGASNGYVVRDALVQLAVVVLAATAAGVLVAVGLGQLVGSEAPFSLQPVPVAGAALALVVLGMVGSLVALRRITGVDPIVALSAES